MLNNLVKDLVLPKEKTELLISRLKQWNLLETDMKITFSATNEINCRHLSPLKAHSGDWQCNDISILMQLLGHQHVLDQWKIFIDASITSLKAALLHNCNGKAISATGMCCLYERDCKNFLEAITIHTRRLVAHFLPKFSSKNRGATYLLDIPVKLAKKLMHDRK